MDLQFISYLCDMTMKMHKSVDIEIDKLTNSIENSVSGDSFDTVVLNFIKTEKGYKKSNWRFDWIDENEKEDRTVYKLVINENQNIIQGLISLSDNTDHVFVHLIESAKFNQGKEKLYLGVAGNLFAFACKKSFDLGYQGFTSFYAKSQLIDYYIKTLGAQHLGGLQLVLDSIAARKLVYQYFNS